ncbi:MAG: RES domain-containing protein [Bacteroidales bacterium]|nr:RES domain-containing protein [Bacteroidales bacterium]
MRNLIEILEKYYNNELISYELLLSQFLNIDGFSVVISPIKRGTTIYRVRKNKGMRSFKNVSQLKCPPPESVFDFGRFNRPHQSAFYASENEDVCFVEMLPNWYETIDLGTKFKVTLTEWITVSDIRVVVLPDFGNVNPKFTKLFSKYSNFERPFWNYVNKYIKIDTKYDKHIHVFTSAFYNSMITRLFIESKRIDGIIYSCVHVDNEINICLNSELINSDFINARRVKEIIVKKDSNLSNGLPKYETSKVIRDGHVNPTSGDIIWN